MKNENLEEMENMDSLTSVLNSLALSNYTTQFTITDQGLISSTTQKVYQPNQVKVVHFYRFEGKSNPGDNAILYAIETNEDEKGTIIDAYGIYNDSLVTDLMKEVEEMNK